MNSVVRNESFESDDKNSGKLIKVAVARVYGKGKFGGNGGLRTFLLKKRRRDQ